MWPLEDNQRFNACPQPLPVRIRPRHVAQQGAVRSARLVQQKRQVRGDQLATYLRDERTEAVLAYMGVQDLQPVLAKRRGNVHRGETQATSRYCTLNNM